MVKEPKLKPSDIRRLHREAQRLIAVGEMPSLAELLSVLRKFGASTPTESSPQERRASSETCTVSSSGHGECANTRRSLNPNLAAGHRPSDSWRDWDHKLQMLPGSMGD